MRTALLAIGAGADTGRTWLVTTGDREDVGHRGRRLLARYRDLVAWATLPWTIDRLAFVPEHHPAAARAESSLALTTLALPDHAPDLGFEPARARAAGGAG